MNIATSRRNLAALISWAIGVRLFCATSMDGALLMNSGWISVLLSLVMALPFALIVALLSRRDPGTSPLALMDRALCPLARRMFCGLLALCSLYEFALSLRLITLSAEFSGLDHQPMLLISSVSTSTALIACLGGAAAISGTVMLWRPLYHSLMVLLVVVLSGSISPRWLFPLLGPGVRQIALSAISFAGMQTSLVAGWLCMGEETGESQFGGKPYRTTGPYLLLRTLLRFAFIGGSLTLLMCMLSPAMPNAPSERDFYLEQFLANDQNATLFQFPLIFIWFINQAIMLCFFLFTAAHLLWVSCPKLSFRTSLLIATALGFTFSLSTFASRIHIDSVNTVRYLVVLLCLTCFGIGHALKQRKEGRLSHDAP